MALTFLVGGVRSGKSRIASDLAARSGRSVVVIATGEPRDEEMTARIARHRAERPAGWITIEEPEDLHDALSRTASDAFVVVDCLTLWVSNLIERGQSDDQIAGRARNAADAAASRGADVVVVSNEVGSGAIPANPLARRFQDVLGTVNTIWASAASRCLYVVAGKVLPLQAVP